MTIRIKKQYKQNDGTIIEVEGSEAEIEAFEKKQKKQKTQIEQSEKKRTILYGKDLEEIRKIVQEELAKIPRYTYDYHYHYDSAPYWRQYHPMLQPVWTGVIGQSAINGNEINSASTVADPNWSVSTVTNGLAPVSYTAVAATGTASYNGPVGVYSSTAACGAAAASRWLGSSNTSNFLMSPSVG